MPSADSGGWRLRTVTLAPASRSRCATGRPSVPVPPVTRIDAAMTSPSTGKTKRGWNKGDGAIRARLVLSRVGQFSGGEDAHAYPLSSIGPVCRCISMPPSMALRIGAPSKVLQLVRPAGGAEFIGGLFADRGRDGAGSLFGQVVPGILDDANDQVVGVAPGAGQAARGEREVALSGQQHGRD